MEKTLMHSGSKVQDFYATLPGPVRVGIEATGTMRWLLSLMEELGVECQVGQISSERKCSTSPAISSRAHQNSAIEISMSGNSTRAGWMPRNGAKTS
jgi:hypothetical protein